METLELATEQLPLGIAGCETSLDIINHRTEIKGVVDKVKIKSRINGARIRLLAIPYSEGVYDLFPYGCEVEGYQTPISEGWIQLDKLSEKSLEDEEGVELFKTGFSLLTRITFFYKEQREKFPEVYKRLDERNK